MSTTRDFLVGVIIGSALGAAAALLYAPATGTETRQLLKDKTTEAIDQANEMAQQARVRVNEVAQQTQTRMGEVRDQVRTRTDEVTGTVRAKAGELSQQAQQAVDRGRHAVEVQKEAVLSAVEAGKQAYQEKQSELQQQVAEDTAPGTGLAPMGSDES